MTRRKKIPLVHAILQVAHDIILGEGAAYGIAIDADPPLRHAEISVQREAFLLDDGDVLVIRDEFLSYGDDLTCRHEWERG